MDRYPGVAPQLQALRWVVKLQPSGVVGQCDSQTQETSGYPNEGTLTLATSVARYRALSLGTPGHYEESSYATRVCAGCQPASADALPTGTSTAPVDPAPGGGLPLRPVYHYPTRGPARGGGHPATPQD